VLPATQFSVHFIGRKVFRSKILTDPVPDIAVLQVTLDS